MVDATTALRSCVLCSDAVSAPCVAMTAICSAPRCFLADREPALDSYFLHKIFQASAPVQCVSRQDCIDINPAPLRDPPTHKASGGWHFSPPKLQRRRKAGTQGRE